MPGEDFIAGEEEFDGLGGLQAAAFAGGFFNLPGEGLQFGDFVGEVVEGFHELVEGADLVFQVAGTAKFAQQVGVGGNGLVEQFDR
ncbi:MAG: hypothetical protein SNJ62_11030, partial [Chloracidobacterium sp.]